MKKILIFVLYIVMVGCGVRGDPLPPEIPAELGRGRPNYKRATEGIQLEEPEEPKDIDDEEEEDQDTEEVF